MSDGNIIDNTPTEWQFVQAGRDQVHIGVAGTFGGASLAVEQLINNVVYPVLDEKVPVVITEAEDFRLSVVAGDRIRLNPTGGTGQDIDYKITGASFRVPF